ncbi:MAG TPA: hypothetical protein VM008_19570 [Phycisphaerae bacterium]|nr:hypothetical protein [Phycisphaerae bacterium]
MNPNEIVAKVIAALHRSKIPFMIVGSFSSNVYGVERTTQDADFVMQLEPHSISKLIQELGPDFKLDPQLGFETVTMTSRYVASHIDPLFKIEFFLISDDAHDLERFSRRRMGQLHGNQLPLPSPEDVIVTKLRWSKGGKRTKDIEDVKNVLAVQTPANLDLPYIRHWTTQHGTRELFEKLLNDTPVI